MGLWCMMTHQFQPGQHSGSKHSDVLLQGSASNFDDILLQEDSLRFMQLSQCLFYLDFLQSKSRATRKI